MQSEIKYVALRFRNPVFAIRAAVDFSRKVGKAIERRLRAPSHFYPPEVSSFISRLTPPAQVRAFDSHRFANLPLSFTGELQLACGRLPFRGDPDWAVRFEDREETESLHRWNWLLTSFPLVASENKTDWGIALVRSWLRFDASRPPHQGAGWNSYSAGERMANFGIFWLLFAGSASSVDERVRAIPSDLRDALEDTSRFVATNLEYLGSDATGNHPFNNARALYIAGTLLSDPVLVGVARAVIQERLGVLLTPDGFLREGSSHYHFLFTRWVLEIRWVAQVMGDVRTLKSLNAVAALLVRRCWFFVVWRPGGYVDIPLFGDVSPDFPPSWLITLPWSRLALSAWRPAAIPDALVSGWSKLWDNCAVDASEAAVGPLASGTALFPDSALYRVVCHDFVMFARAEADPGQRYASHRHADLAGFVLFWRGEPILIDPARANYRTDDPMGLYGLSSRSHNSVLVDDNGPQPPLEMARLPTFYRRTTAQVTVSETPEVTTVTLKHDGFSRLGGIGEHRRVWSLRETSMQLEDYISGTGARSVETVFHFASGVSLAPAAEGVVVKSANRTIGTFCAEAAQRELAPNRIIPPGAALPGEGKCWRQYDVASESAMLVYRTVCSFPHAQRCSLKLEP